jgi:hypothetical protein
MSEQAHRQERVHQPRYRQRASDRQARLDAARLRWAQAADQMSAAAQRAQRHT